jgi:hypothetical protein
VKYFLLFYTEIQNLKIRKRTREEDEYEDGVSSRVCNKQSLRERESVNSVGVVKLLSLFYSEMRI